LKYLSILIIVLVLAACKFISPHKNIKVGVQPYHNFDVALTDTIAKTIEQSYGFEVAILPVKPLPKTAFIHVKSPRYRADSLLLDLKRNKSKDVDYLLGLTSTDISTSKYVQRREIKKPESKYADWGVFGLGYKPGPSCIVSTYRLKTNNQKQFISRLKKVCIHELGHNLGLPHCETPKCVMQDAVESIRTVDSANFEFCEKCKRRIR
jgi:archaemetzincin